MTGERITMVDVRNKVAALASIAKNCGFDTKEWGVHRGTKHYALTYTRSGSSTPVVRDLGESAREACSRLDWMMLGMTMAYENLSPSRTVKVLKAALLAVDKMEVHLRKCSHCSLHLLGKRTGWCEMYTMMIKIRDEGMMLATSENRNRYPQDRTVAV